MITERVLQIAPAGRKNIEKIIELKNLTKRFGVETVVDNVNLNIRRGEFVTFLGPSGCGKTTTLRMIAGFETPTAGNIFLDGVDITKIPPHKRPVNTVFQKYVLFPHLDVFNNIAFGLKLKVFDMTPDEVRAKYKKFASHTDEQLLEMIAKAKMANFKRKFTKAEIKEKVNAYLKLVGLDDFGHRDVETLSGGQQQRVAIARALVNQPRVLLLDEPLGALDLKMRKEMQLELKRMHRELGLTFIYVTHDQEEALTLSDRIVVMNDGVIQQVGTPKAIYDEPKNAFVADFIGESNIISGTMLRDYRVRFMDVDFDCTDKGFDKNEPVDIVIRPEDVELTKKRTQLTGTIISSIFKGTYYEKIVKVGEYEFTAHTQEDIPVDTKVGLEFKPDNIHIMEKEEVINEIKTYVMGEGTINISGAEFKVSRMPKDLAKGAPVTAFIEFKNVELTDDEADGQVGATVTNTIYMGTHYTVKVWTDNDIPFIVETEHEWDINDRVGISIKPKDIRVEMRAEDE